MLSAAAFLANLAVILFLSQLPRKESFVRPMLGLYVCLAGVNLGLSFMISADSAGQARFFLFLWRPFLFFLSPLFLWTVITLTGARRSALLLGPGVSLAVLMTIATGIAYLTGSSFFIREMQALPWGFVPRAAIGAALGLGGLFLVSLPSAFFLLGRAILRKERIAGVSPVTLSSLFALWWAGMSSNGLSLAGFNFFPLGSLTDAVMSFVITAYLHRRSHLNQRSRRILRIAGMLASLCPGVLVTWFFLEFILPGSPVANGLVGLITASVSLFVFHRWYQRLPGPGSGDADENTQPLFVTLQNRYGLTYQEARICEELHRGRPRAEIVRGLGVTDGTFRNHLSEIYRKTVEQVESPDAGRRDKWQRLTVFLHNLAQS